ncbi:MAG: N-acetylneuraminate synthase [Paludibacteraceae bacterium]|nr:N-acetylneuraminate synthase [Paludibacteraceae bacterium]
MSKHVLIIAEAGVNHNGSLDLAKQLIDKAVEAGVDIIKFQTFKSEKLVSKAAKQAEYQQRNIGKKDEGQLAMLKKLELSQADHEELIAYCNEKGIRFFSTAFDMDSIDYLHSLNMGIWKIPSGEITNYPYLRKIAQYQEPVILSTGMCELTDIEAALNVLLQYGVKKEQITILHCNTEYPTPFADVNLKAMLEIGEKFGVQIGYSDHTKGIEVPIAAVALGATVVEKHFTLDKNMEGPDHKASLEPDELKAMVSAIRNIEQALGSGHKTISESERKNIEIARKSIVAACPIKAGELLTEENLTVKRPGNGINPMRWNEVVGTRAVQNYNEEDPIELAEDILN